MATITKDIASTGSLKGSLQVSTSTSGNTVTVTAQLYIINTTTWEIENLNGCTLDIDGSGKTQTVNVSVTTAGTRLLLTHTKTYTYTSTHSDITVKGSIKTAGIVHTGYGTLSNCNLEVTQEMPNLNGSSIITTGDGTFGVQQTFTVTNLVSSNYISVNWRFGSLSGPIIDKKCLTSFLFTPKDTWYSEIPNSKYGTCYLDVTTYKSDKTTVVGTATYNFKVYCVEEECIPEVTMTATETNKSLPVNEHTGGTATTQTLTGGNKIIRYISDVLCSATATAKHGASIKSIAFKYKDETKAIEGSSGSVTFTKVDSKYYWCVVTDSRGFTYTSNSIEIPMVNYIPITNSSRAKRKSTTDTHCVLTAKGDYFYGNFGATTNYLTVANRRGSGTWYPFASTSFEQPTENNFNFNLESSFTFNANDQYKWFIRVYDKVMYADITLTIPRAIPHMGWGKYNRSDGTKADVTVIYSDLIVKGKTALADVEADLSSYYTRDEVNSLLNNKQAKLTSGTNIKTINGQSVLGSGDITIQGGSGGGGWTESEVNLLEAILVNNAWASQSVTYQGSSKTMKQLYEMLISELRTTQIEDGDGGTY